MAPWLDQGAVGVWRYLRTVSVVAPAFGGCPTSGLRSDNHVGLLFSWRRSVGLHHAPGGPGAVRFQDGVEHLLNGSSGRKVEVSIPTQRCRARRFPSELHP